MIQSTFTHNRLCGINLQTFAQFFPFEHCSQPKKAANQLT